MKGSMSKFGKILLQSPWPKCNPTMITIPIFSIFSNSGCRHRYLDIPDIHIADIDKFCVRCV